MLFYIDYWLYWYLHRVIGEHPFKVFIDMDYENYRLLEFRYLGFYYSKFKYGIELDFSTRPFINTISDQTATNETFPCDNDKESWLLGLKGMLIGKKYDYSAILTSSGVMLKVEIKELLHDFFFKGKIEFTVQ